MNFMIVNVLVTVAFLQGITGAVGQLEKQFRLASPLKLYAGNNDDANCTGVIGNTCGKKPADCDSIFLCIPSMPDPIKAECEEGKFCNEGVCSDVKSPFCEYGDREFKCNNEGMYPEPSSCKEFNYCVPKKKTFFDAEEIVLDLTKSQCPDDWSFNPATASCDKKLTNNKCAATDRPVPSCTKAGQNGALKGNPSMYYICTAYKSPGDKALYPHIFKCPGNEKYVGNYLCK